MVEQTFFYVGREAEVGYRLRHVVGVVQQLAYDRAHVVSAGDDLTESREGRPITVR